MFLGYFLDLPRPLVEAKGEVLTEDPEEGHLATRKRTRMTLSVFDRFVEIIMERTGQK